MKKPAGKPSLAYSLALCLAAASWALAAEDDSHWSTPAENERYSTELREFYKGNEVRFPGSPGNLAIEAKVASAFAASTFVHGEIRFKAPVFRPGASTFKLNGAQYTIQPMHPTVMRPGNFKEDAFDAPLIYMGHAGVDELNAAKGIDLTGAVVALDFNCGADWIRLLRFGVKGFIFVGQSDYDNVEVAQKVYETETATARFFISEQDGKRLIAALRESKTPPTAHFECKASIWENTDLRDLWMVVPGSDEKLKGDVCVICAPIDSNCVVPERAEGAVSGANLFLLLQLLKDFQKTPPARTVMLVAVNAHTHYYLGERMLATHLLSPAKDLDSMRDLFLDDQRREQMFAGHYRNFLDKLNLVKANPKDPAPIQQADELIATLRTQVDSDTGKLLPVKKPLQARLSRDTNQAKSLSSSSDPVVAAQKSKEYDQLLNIQMLFNKYGATKRMAELTPEELDRLIEYVTLTYDENDQAAKLNQADLDLIQANNAVRTALQSRNVSWVLTLGLAWRGGDIGLCSGAYWDNPDWRNGYAAKLMDVSNALSAANGHRNLLANTMTFEGTRPESYYFAMDQGLPVFQNTQKTPAFALQDIYWFGNPLFTPADTFDRLNATALGETAAFTQKLLREMAAADTAALTKPNTRASWPMQIKTMQYDRFSSEVLPEVPVENAFVIIRNKSGLTMSNDVVMSYMQLTDARATAYFYCLREYWTITHTAAYQLDPHYREVLRTIDGGAKEAALTSNITQTAAQTYVMFPCREFPIYTRDDTSSIGANGITVGDYKLLDAKRESAPEEEGAGGVAIPGSDKKFLASPGPASVYVAETTNLKILSGLPVLNSTDTFPEGVGFPTAAEFGPDYYSVAARDLDKLNRYRLGRLHGVSIELASDFLKKGKAALADADTFKAQHNYIGFLQAQHTAVGAERAAYTQLGNITNDMLRGVIFYMALILPFCFFMQKLLFNFVKIEAQIVAFFALFIGAYLLFRQIHPAFAVAKAPEGILIAFCMGALASFVIKILHGRFEGEMAMMFQNHAGSDAADVGYGTVGQKAMLIGVNNMRRRRLRTALTTATIVLITFTMLSFTSISQTMSPTTVNVSHDPPPYTGLMYHWPGKRMDEATLSAMKEIFYGKGDVVVRRWLLPPAYNKMTFPFPAVGPTGGVARIESVLGLSVQEDGFLGKFPLLAGRYFSSDGADEVIIPSRVAEALHIDRDHLQGAKLRFTFGDRDLDVVGIVDDEALRRLKDLDGYLLIPQKDGAPTDNAPGSGGADAAGGGGTGKDQSGMYNDTATMLIMPIDRAARFGALPYSLSVRLNAQNQDIWQQVLHLLTVTQANFYMGSQMPYKATSDDQTETEKQNAQTFDAGVYYIGSGFKTSTNNLSSLIIPLLISGTIILNTMLGSVFERKKEIAIYNAVGLNPNHIGMFFLSEAFVYGIVGSVGGYLIGQILSILLIHFGVVGIDLNFASLKVIYVILFTIAMVLLSTLYPAIVATRAAVPSGKRKWEFPEHDGHTMQIFFPFIYQTGVVAGVMTYLEEYFQRFTEASMGDLIASNGAKSKGKDAQGRDTYTLAYDVALAPFDLGVTQRVTFTAAYNERVQSYGITLTSVRISGQDTNWVTTNKPFLERLRTYLMHWRSLTPQEQAEYAKTTEQAIGAT